MSPDDNNSNGQHVNKDTFEIYKEYVDEKFDQVDKDFKTVHACNQRVEKKVDDIATELKSRNERKEERSFQLKSKIAIIFVTMISGVIGSAITVFLIGR